MVRPLKLQDWQAVMADHARALDRLTGAAQMRRHSRRLFCSLQTARMAGLASRVVKGD